MLNAHTIEADRTAKDGAAAGEKLWLIIELTSANGMRATRRVTAFGCMLEQAVDEMTDGFDEGRALFAASAMLAVRMVVDAKTRTKIDRNASDAYSAYVAALMADASAQIADHQYADARAA